MICISGCDRQSTLDVKHLPLNGTRPDQFVLVYHWNVLPLLWLDEQTLFSLCSLIEEHVTL